MVKEGCHIAAGYECYSCLWALRLKINSWRRPPLSSAQSIYYLTWCSLKDYEQTERQSKKCVISFQVKGNVIFLTLHTAPYNSRLTINLVVGAQ